MFGIIFRLKKEGEVCRMCLQCKNVVGLGLISFFVPNARYGSLNVQRPAQAFHFTKSLLLRWKAGERVGLWGEAQAAARKPTQVRSQRGPTADEIGRSGEALKRLTSKTPAVRRKGRKL